MNREELARLLNITEAEAGEFLTPEAMAGIQVNNALVPPASPLSIIAQWAEYEARRPLAYGAGQVNSPIQTAAVNAVVNAAASSPLADFMASDESGFDVDAWGLPRQGRKLRVRKPKPPKPAPRPFGESPRRVLL